MRELKNLEFEEIMASCSRIAEIIKQKGWEIDVVVPILKGGMNVGALIANKLDIDEFCCVHTRSSESNKTNANLAEPKLLGVTNTKSVFGKNVLICDDIFDTGRSLKLAQKTMLELGAKNIYMAVVVNVNKKAENIDNIVYDMDFSKNNNWIVFPWEK